MAPECCVLSSSMTARHSPDEATNGMARVDGISAIGPAINGVGHLADVRKTELLSPTMHAALKAPWDSKRTEYPATTSTPVTASTLSAQSVGVR